MPGDATGIFGTLVVPEKRMDGKCVNRVLKTLERPDLDNKPRESCIPMGEYQLRRKRSGKRFYEKYKARWGHDFVVEIAGVPDRHAILLHVGNWALKDSTGCVLIGTRQRREPGKEKMLMASVDGYKVWYALVSKLFDEHGDDLVISIREEQPPS